MKTHKWSKNVLLVCGALLLSCAQVMAQAQSSGDIEQERGRNEASQDVKRGEFVIKEWGNTAVSARFGNLPASSDDLYHSMLVERYKIRYEALGTCFVDDDTLRYIAGYNQVSIPAIEAK